MKELCASFLRVRSGIRPAHRARQREAVVMAWDFSEETVRVLTDGLPEPPPAAVPGLTFPAALHRGDYFGAVLFLRLWRNGNWDSDTAITCREGSGWAYPSSCGGGGWINPYNRPIDGWNGDPLMICGGSGSGMEEDDGHFRYATAVDGLAAKAVAAIECTAAGKPLRYSIDARLGAFVIVVEGEERPMLSALGRDGTPLASI
jgi:hypothetical protein